MKGWMEGPIIERKNIILCAQGLQYCSWRRRGDCIATSMSQVCGEMTVTRLHAYLSLCNCYATNISCHVYGMYYLWCCNQISELEEPNNQINQW